jgi:SAM-dependent methyltransferase
MTTGFILLLVVMVLFGAVALSYVYYDFKTGVPTFPTMPAVREKIARLLQDELARRPERASFTVIDLGSGSGQMTEYLAATLPGAQIIGIEISFIPWLRSVLRQRWRGGPKNLTYRRLDFWAYDIGKADVVIVYQLYTILERVSAKLRDELPSGAVILANTFALAPPWQAEATFSIPAPLIASLSGKTDLFLYRKA